jgi:hypothetical protein
MKRSKTKERNLRNHKVLSSREQAKIDKEKISGEPTELDKLIDSLKCPKLKTPGLCEFGKHNPNFNKYAING